VAATQSGTWTVGISGGQTIAVTNTGTFAVQAAVTGTVSISGSVAVTGTFWQATQPVSIAGTVAVSLASTTITGTVAVTQSTSPWVVSGTVTTTPSGLQNVNLTELNTVALGSPSNYGTSPGTVSVQGVNAFITNTPAVTLASTTITGSVAVTGTFWQATQPVSIAGTVAVSLASTTITGTVAVTQSTSPWVISGTVITTPPANASTNLTELNSVALGSPSNYGTSPGAIAVQGVNAFITNTPAVTLASTTITGAVAVTQSTSPWVISGTVTTTPSGLQNVNITQLNSVALGSPSNYGTSPGAVAVIGVNAFITNTVPVTLTSTTITGSVAVTGTFFQSTQPVSIAAAVAVTQSTSPWVVSGTVTTTPPANASTNITQWDSVALGAPSAYGTSPGAITVPGVNAFITNTPAVTLASTTITGTVAVTQSTTPWVITGNLTNNNAVPTATLTGVLSAIAETAYATVTYTTGDMVLPVTDLHGALNYDLQAVAGTAVVAASAGVQKVGVSGATGATLDAVITAATAPANGVATLAVYNSTAPALTTGQSVASQCDYEGNLFVKPIRRSQTVLKFTTCTTVAATTILGAQASGVFADISNLIMTVTGATAAAFTITVSDGTNAYIFDATTGAATSTGTQFNINFNPPLPASNAATAWTLAMSAANTVHTTVVAVLQKAS
jgi:hypothetical protein